MIEPQNLTVAELYELIWQYPMSRMATRLGVSDRGLAKCCQKYGIPTPPRGHWTKVELGKPVARPPLNVDCEQAAVVVSLPVANPFSSQTKHTKRERSEAAQRIERPIVKKQLNPAHPLVTQWLLEVKNLESEGIAERQEVCLSEIDSYRLRVTNAFFSSIESIGARIISARVDGRFDVEIGKAKLRVSIKQKMSESARLGVDLKDWTIWPHHHSSMLYPTRNLKFSISGNCISPLEFACSPKEVERGGLKRLVTCVLAAKSAAERKELAKLEAARLRSEQLKIVTERCRKEAADEEKWIKLQMLAEQWERSERIRCFITMLKEKSQSGCVTKVEGERYLEWAKWAEEKLTQDDPLRLLMNASTY